MKTSKELSVHADNVARRFLNKPIPEWDSLRDLCEHETYGALDSFQLDLLTDLAEVRIRRNAKGGAA